MKSPLDMSVEELTNHIERRKKAIASEEGKPRYKRDEKYIRGLIAKQRMWMAIRQMKIDQPPLF